jgi:DNA-binding NarL/FixJ family response regulator
VDLIPALRAIHPNLQVIVLSGRGDQASIDQAKAAGVNEYLIKPCGFADLEAAVQRACEVPAN